MLKKSIIAFSLFLLVSGFHEVHGQRKNASKKEQIAVQYYQNEKFEKAIPIFKELFNANPSSDYLYEYYLNSLLKTKSYDQALSMLNEQTKRFPDNLTYAVALGYVQEQQGDKDAAKETYKSILKRLKPRPEKLKTIANTFKNRGKLNYAIKVYKKGRKLVGNEKAFSIQLARLYRQTGENQEAMFKSYLDAFLQDPNSEGVIKNELQELVMNQAPFETFKGVLLKQIRSKPDERRLIDLLAWLFIQNEAFDQAFIQLKALQKRLGTNGQRLIELAKVARKNKALGVAEDVFRYLINLGPENPYYFRARQGVLEVQYDRITKEKDYTQEDLRKLEKGYRQFMNDERFSYAENGKVTIRLAEIQALYLDKVNKAIDLLESLIDKGAGGREKLKAKALIALGDYYLLKGKEADAQLTYSKVEKMFEGAPLGNKATFRKAKLSFYKGNFDWAGSQLKVLKGSTSKMISNDAIQLDMLIQDNRGLDTTEVPLQMFAKADMYLFKKQYERAQNYLDSILQLYPDHNLTDEVYYTKAKIAKANRRYDSATNLLKTVYQEFKNDILADDAIYMAAQLYENQLGDQQKAKELYELLVTDYSGSIYQLKAREAYRVLRGDKIN